MEKNKNLLPKIVLLAVAVFIVVIINIVLRWKWQDSYQTVSPDGNTVIVMEYDSVSRPSVYKKTGLHRQKIWEYKGSGFMERMEWKITWISTTRIEIGYEDPSHDTSETFFVDL